MPHPPQDQSATIAMLAQGAEARIDTNAAILFLGQFSALSQDEDRVVKLKRAVDLGFLDFTTLAARKSVCEAEVALNRRTAPDLYLGVEAVVRGADGRLALGGEGDPVDYVVVMRRFPSGDLLAEVAARGGLTAPMLRDLADGVAAFHAEAAVAQGSGATRMAAIIAGNRRSFAALPQGALDASKVALWARRAEGALAHVAPLLDARAAAGKVRHCHGDLHLANICLWQGRPVAFDCLEFSEELATTDVLYDLAFLLMDLWERGHREKANLVFNRYCDRIGGQTGEEDGLPALPLFLSVRAAIRAHVGAAGAMRQADSAARATKLDEARAYLDAALGFLEGGARGLVAVGGLSGTGKSTLAGALAARIGAAPGARWLRSDVLRKLMAGVAPEERLPPASYTREASAAVYAEMDRRARDLPDWPVVADAVFADTAERAGIAACGAPFLGLWLEAPEAVLVARVDARRDDASDADAAVVARQRDYAIGPINWQRIDASGSPQQTLDAALAALAQHGFILQKP